MSSTDPKIGRADYAERIEAKRARLETAADNARNRADAGYRRMKDIMDGIPMGQPILVGHHSERRHRRDLERADRGMRTFVEEGRKADYLADRAAGLGESGISQDDPEALTKLRERLAELEAAHETMKRANAILRKHGNAAAAVQSAELDPGIVAEMIRARPWYQEGDRLSFPAYALQNSNANIRRIKERIKALEQAAAVNASGGLGEIVTDHYTVTDDVAENRIVLVLNDRVERDVFTWIRSMGWRWARTQGAFLAYRNKWAHLSYFLPELERRAGWADA